MIFQLLSTLMNTMVVELMKEVSGDRVVERHASERALEGYCARHHLLLAFAKRYPSIEAMVNKQVDEFIAFEDEHGTALQLFLAVVHPAVDAEKERFFLC